MLAALLTILTIGGEPGRTMQPDPASQLEPIAAGPFQGNLDSLKSNRYPDWFIDGKLGIWSHWGPQAVPMEGDWYARQMYEEANPKYRHHLETFGHPSKVGFKDIIPLWKAEKWDPERLMDLYKAAGATYFVSMGAHHDNFDLWDSKHQPKWNSVKMGPKRDVVGDWRRAAKERGLRFGVSEHLGASWTWFQTSRGADKDGEFKGIPYDGNDPAYEDLYHPKALEGDTGWYTTDPRWHAQWFRRVKDVVDRYKPDLLYSDGPLPFGRVGESLVAHLYNVTMKDGVQQAVYNCKQPSEGRWAQDVERGVMAGIQPHPWQTDTSIGDWYYNRHWKYRGADWVIQTLVDVISKNGNLLINVVQRPDGSLDPEAEQVLADMAAWMKVNSESIYGTRPWLVFGEGPTRLKGGAFKEEFAFTGKDVRYVRKGEETLYATLLGAAQPGELVLRSLSKSPGDDANIQEVALLGSPSKLQWTWNAQGLHLVLPEGMSSKMPVVLKIEGQRLREFHSVPDPFPVEPKAPTPTIEPEGDGSYRLTADKADLPEGDVRVETRSGIPNLGYWDNPLDVVSWNVRFAEKGEVEVMLSVASVSGTTLEIEVAGTRRVVQIPKTADWDTFVEVPVGTFAIAQPGVAKVLARPSSASWHPMNLRWIRLK